MQRLVELFGREGAFYMLGSLSGFLLAAVFFAVLRWIERH